MCDYFSLPLLCLQPETKEIPLTQGKIAVVDAADFEWLMQWKWYAKKDGYKWYARRTARLANGKQATIMMHRFVLNAESGVEVDHKNGNGLDNRRSNLRTATHQQNVRNVGPRANNKSGYKGVCWDGRSNNWRATIQVEGKYIGLGLFPTAEDAARAYDLAAREKYGEFAFLNRPPEYTG